jgi:predicted ribosomally synthesized peptide with nif11-like leader
MNSEMERFGKDLTSNEALRAAAKAAGTDPAAVVKLANSKGYNFTFADLESGTAEGELSDGQLEAVAGGAISVFAGSWGRFFRWD